MELVSAGIILTLAIIALVGWVRAWRLGRGAAKPSRPKLEPGSSLSEVQRQASDSIAESIQQASELFQKNLTVQALKINDELEGLARQRLRKQVQDFAAVLDGLTTTATATVGQLQTLIDQRREAIEEATSAEVKSEKERALEHFYGRLNDVVATYIIESLGNEIDLSGQLPFVVKTLEQNKEIIKQDLLRDY